MSGHSFDAEGKCACGAELKQGQTKNLYTEDFSASTTAKANLGSIAIDTDKGVWDINKNATYYFSAANNPDFADLLDGEANGEEIVKVTISFDFQYSGEFYGKGGYFMYASGVDANSTTQHHWSFSYGKEAAETEGEFTGKVQPGDSSNRIVMNPGETYKFKIDFDVAGGTSIKSYINDLLQKSAAKYPLENFTQLQINAVNAYDGNTASYAAWIDNFAVDYVYNAVDTTNQVTPVVNP